MSRSRLGRAPSGWSGRAGWVALAAVLLLATGCGSDSGAVYRDSAVRALEGTLSEARTAELAGRLWVAGRSTHSFALVVVGDSDTAMGADAAWFEEQQPPRPGDDLVRRQTTDALDAASSSVQAVRIAVDRRDVRATRTALEELGSACSDLATLAERLS
ncbi:MAG TPA: hypothetical protein VLA55_11735 [Ornithinibacter sp.]|nr:hypothetical protein [Ornithinibacter sp.]